jgi:hypothetical protein
MMTLVSSGCSGGSAPVAVSASPSAVTTTLPSPTTSTIPPSPSPSQPLPCAAQTEFEAALDAAGPLLVAAAQDSKSRLIAAGELTKQIGRAEFDAKNLCQIETQGSRPNRAYACSLGKTYDRANRTYSATLPSFPSPVDAETVASAKAVTDLLGRGAIALVVAYCKLP